MLKRITPVLFLLLVACHGQKHVASSDSDNALRKKYAGILQVDEKEITNLRLYRFIDEWYGVPYKYGGKTKAGIDCSGLTCTLYSEVYGKTISGSAASLNDQCEEVKEKNLAEGDLVFFKIGSDKVSHVGVYLQNRHFVHASTHKGVMISSLDEAYYQKYFFRGGKLK
ncbi:MAG TPA: NlpC/P60 family protein [Bacteroidia bacterium]|nr:NlpC/P60 family protein [Bacteroidia bacterium]